MSVRIRAELHLQPLQALTQGLSPEAVSNAWRRALRKTGNSIKTQVARQVSRECNIPQKVLKQRLYFYLRSQRMQGKVWLGANPLGVHRLGRPRQTQAGVSVGRHRFPGAWIFKGKRASNLDGKVFKRTGAARTPYQMVEYQWDEAGERAFQAAAKEAETRLYTVLEQELNYELLKIKGIR